MIDERITEFLTEIEYACENCDIQGTALVFAEYTDSGWQDSVTSAIWVREDPENIDLLHCINADD